MLQNVPVQNVDFDLIVPNFPIPISNERVGGKLHFYLKNWEKITQDSFCLSVIKDGYKPVFKDKPPLVRNPQPYTYDLSEEHLKALDTEVENFLHNNVIEEVKDLNSPGFYSCLFVRPRSNDSPNRWRCIFDISDLNTYLVAPKFKMESTNTIRKLLKIDHYCVKLDLSDAFLHVPLHNSFKKYMRFFHRGKAYQFKTICFGANFSPYIFSYLINIVMRFFHKCNIEIAAYLDDMYSQHPVPATLKHQIFFVAKVLSYLGWTVNFDKSITDPQQLMDYIGLHINLRSGLVFPPADRWQKIQTLANKFLALHTATAKQWCSLLGLLTSCQDLTQMGRLWLRPLQTHLNAFWKKQKKSAPTNSHHSHMQGSLGLVAELRQCHDWSSLDPPPTRPDYLHRQLGPGMGWQPRQPESGRQVDSSIPDRTYQSKRNDGRVESHISLQRSADQQKHFDSQRQHHSGMLPKQTRGNQVSISPSTNCENPPVVPRPQNLHQSPSHPRQIQCHQRPAVTSPPGGIHRVIHSSKCDRPNLKNLGQTNGRPLCNKIQPQVTHILFSNPGPKSPGNRCNVTELDRTSSICIPTSGSITTGTKQNQPRTVHSVPGSPGLEFQVVVPQPPKPPSGPSQSSSSNKKTSKTTSKRNIPRQSQTTQPTRLEVIQQRLRAKGFSEKSARSIAQRCRGSTNRLYEAKWKTYSNWCNQRKIDCFKITTQQLSDFFTHLAEEKQLSVSAMQGYKAVINSTIKLCTAKDVCNNFYLSSQFRSYKHQRSLLPDRVPKWNLNLVLNSLTKPPYEPILESSMKHLTWKTTFLTAFATAARVSELAALSKRKVAHNEDWSKMTLTTNKNFIAKNQDLTIDSSPRQFEIPALYDFAGPDLPDRLLCPVRAMRMYLHKSKKLRTKEKKALFISHSPKKHGDITANTISNWIKNVIKLAYKNAQDEDLTMAHVRAHEVRALAASVAFSSNLALRDINKACYWRGHSTFTSYYLRELAMSQDGVLILPNVIAASFKITQ